MPFQQKDEKQSPAQADEVNEYWQGQMDSDNLFDKSMGYIFTAVTNPFTTENMTTSLLIALGGMGLGGALASPVQSLWKGLSAGVQSGVKLAGATLGLGGGVTAGTGVATGVNPMTGEVMDNRQKADMASIMVAGLLMGAILAAPMVKNGINSLTNRIFKGAEKELVGDLAENSADGAAKGTLTGNIIPDGQVDPAATMLGNRFGGQASVRLKGFGNREFDFISDRYVGQTFGGDTFVLKPKNFLSKSRRNQIRETMEAAKAYNRSPLFNFEGGPPHPDVLEFINRNAERIGITPKITYFIP